MYWYLYLSANITIFVSNLLQLITAYLMDLNNRINAFVELGSKLNHLLTNEKENGQLPVEERQAFDDIIVKAKVKNAWFTDNYVKKAFREYANLLTEEKLLNWLKPYENELVKLQKPKKVGLIMAGNIPLVGFHDMLSILISGNILHARFSSDDSILTQFVLDMLFEIEPEFKKRVKVVDRLSDIDAVIATGSNNSSRYFEAYFGKYPHIIRKNRNAVAVLSGNESEEELKAFGHDIFDYFGLGCRNVSKVYVPQDFKLDFLFEGLQSFSHVLNHNKYMNNYDMHSAILLLKQVPFLTNNFIILKEDKAIASPLAMIHYERYANLNDVKKELKEEQDNIQCMVSNSKEIENVVPLGQSQQPGLSDYADGINTMQFLLELE